MTKDIKTQIAEQKERVNSPAFIMGDPSEMIKDIYNKLDLIMNEINKIKEVFKI